MKRSTFILSTLAISVIAGQAWWIASHHSSAAPSSADNKIAAAKPVERKPLYWYDPMKPDAHFDKPGPSPFMDMELVPMYADESAEADPVSASTGGTVKIDPQMVQNFGLRTAKVTRGSSNTGIHATGSVQIDESRIVVIESRTAGWVEQLNVNAVGDTIKRGQSVAGVYSPDLYAAQQELALATRSQDERLVDAARQRLSLQGLSTAQVSAVLKSGQAQRRALIAAPLNGVVTELNVREGQQVTPGMPLMRVADLSKVWIVVEVPESISASLSIGQVVEARVSALPGEALKGKVDYVYPSLDAQARTVRARMIFDNPKLMLKPGMYADVALAGNSAQKDGLSVPSEAVIRTGERNVVILALGQGKFRPAVVQVGEERNGSSEILSGIEEGETVVVSGQFLIDSEASLRGTLARMQDAEHKP
ncbi:efflux RND transporter periplasmic adaptor subunit [Stenotrophobium rhamnosiphilum]|uniref:Efflux RND transporter periplasmic adaptor subunit n=1 Tax=Stenotrophobium rhamnosiphilum TaxID=2029166 RepID=A0A2T5MG30_9GAMM|nr:efflux RND transporter periplasmic adaptor subunit [Stenotrophobium rhamnosiphilum]PTU31535.1 efflux RND transporter periplasmic adaptor subunit [Stenotrophobium rhamnosiphilum]